MLVTCVTAWIDANREWTMQKAGQWVRAYVSPASPESLTQTHKGPGIHLSRWHRDEHRDGSHSASLSAWTTCNMALQLGTLSESEQLSRVVSSLTDSPGSIHSPPPRILYSFGGPHLTLCYGVIPSGGAMETHAVPGTGGSVCKYLLNPLSSQPIWLQELKIK